MVKATLSLCLLVIASAMASAQTTTYYQTQVYSYRGTSVNGRFDLYNSTYKAQDGTFLELSQIVVAPNFDCVSGGGNNGWVIYNSTCYPIQAPTVGPNISVNTNGHVCTGPSSVHLAWDGGYYDSTLTFVWRGGRAPSCYTETLTSSVTLD